MNDFRKITVTSITRKGRKSKLIIQNPTSLKLIGQGAQGAVFKLSSKRCVKIFAVPKKAKKESKIMKEYRHLSFMPRVYEVGPNFIVMEYFKGPSLDHYLRKRKKLPFHISKQMISVLQAMKSNGFTRIDTRLRHMYLRNEKVIKVIDHVNAFSTREPYPIKLFNDLRKMGLLKVFLVHLKDLDQKNYKDWKKAYHAD